MAEILGLVASVIAVGQALAAIPPIVDALSSLPRMSDDLVALTNEV
jgi:hypothetical protein